VGTVGSGNPIGHPRVDRYRLFTPLGERDWAPDWQPHFPVATVDDGEPGTTFITDAHGHARIWVVVERARHRRIRYVNVAPGDRASLITVDLTPIAIGSEVMVTYDMTALSDAGARRLVQFADGYERYLDSWQEQIVAYLRGPASAVV
jgi:hypothetical protein